MILTYLVTIETFDEDCLMPTMLQTIVTGTDQLQELIKNIPEDYNLVDVKCLGRINEFESLIKDWKELNKPDDLNFG